ncbi:MAG: hypothetical protein RI964_993 [Pseudomonadota bacterium]|jgi:CRISPR-associated protein Csx16
MRLISFLGTGNYAETIYTFNDKQSRTRYIAAALSEFFKVDSIIILATKEAYSAHAKGLSDELERLSLPKPDIRTIPSGGATEELWKQFEIIHAAVVDNQPASISFDITHGFRSQPFFAAAVINYLRATLKNSPDMQAYYGEWRKDEATSPVWDISTFINLLDWSSSLQSFMKTGHGAGLAQLARKENISIQKSAKGQRPVTLDKLASSIRAFSENISTVRVENIITGSATQSGSAANVLACIDKSEKEVKQYLSPLYPVLMELKTKISEVPANNLFNPTGYKAMLALAKLYVDYERYPEAAIVLREGWVSLYAAKDRSVNELMSKAERSAAEERWYEAETEKENAEGCADLLGSVRNDIQHGGFRPNPNPADKLIKNLNELIDKFSKRLSENSQGNLHELLDIK